MTVGVVSRVFPDMRFSIWRGREGYGQEKRREVGER